MNSKASAHNLCLIGIFTAIIAVCAQLSIPMPYGVPMTMQTLAVQLAGIILGSKKGFVSSVVYLLLALAGLPVLAGFSGGIGIVFGYTGGFILSFPVLAFAAGIGSIRNSWLWLAIWLVLGSCFNLLCGMVYFSFVTANDLKTAFIACVLPFIPTTVIRIVFEAVLGKRAKVLLSKSGAPV